MQSIHKKHISYILGIGLLARLITFFVFYTQVTIYPDSGGYLELAERFIALHPHYLPNARTADSSYTDTFTNLMVDEEFMAQVSDKGLLVWANSNFLDFLDALDVYTGAYPEINVISRYFERHIQWFNRLYAYLRAKLILHLREQGRNI